LKIILYDLGQFVQIDFVASRQRTEPEPDNMKTTTTMIQSSTTLTARSVCDYDCIFSLEVIERKGCWATIKYMGVVSRTKIKTDDRGEYIMPKKYSMAPIFRA